MVLGQLLRKGASAYLAQGPIQKGCAHGVKPYILHPIEPVPGPKIIRSHVSLDVRGVISRWT
jgi:hypothetical protein